ncbi:MAG: hypothetical protein ACI3ZP_04395 [Candidatus Cryptobacteroides sp.]
MTAEEKRNRALYAKEAMECDIKDAAERLYHLLKVNEQRSPETKVDVATTVSLKEGGFIAVCGSAHRMQDAFIDLFKNRPEMRSVVQGALDLMYRVDMM